MSKPQPQRRPPTFDHLRSRKKPTTRRVDIALDPDAAGVLDEARSALEVARLRHQAQPNDAERSAEHDSARAAFDAAREAAADETVTFVLRSIGSKAYDRLVEDHRPSEAKSKEWKKRNPGQEPPEWDDETFPPALVAASLVEPELDEDEVRQLWEDPAWNMAELMALFLAAVEVNQQRRTVDLRKD